MPAFCLQNKSKHKCIFARWLGSPEKIFMTQDTSIELEEQRDKQISALLESFNQGQLNTDQFLLVYYEICANYYEAVFNSQKRDDDTKEKLTEGKLAREFQEIAPVISKSHLTIYLNARMGENQITASKLRAVRELVMTRSDSLTYSDKPELVNTWAGVLNARTKKIQSRFDEDENDILKNYRHMVTNYNPNAKSPTFERVLKGLNTDYNPNLGEDLLKMYAYAVFGGGSQKTLFFLWGDGDDGKTLIQRAIADAVGEYSKTIKPSKLKYVRDSEDTFQPWLVDMQGRKLLLISEWGKNDKLNTSLSKILASGGGVPLFLEVKNSNEEKKINIEFSVFIDTNFLPDLSSAEEALIRRLAVVKLTRSYSKDEQDSSLKDKLYAERAGILNMLIDAYDPNWKIPQRYYDEGRAQAEAQQLENKDVLIYMLMKAQLRVDVESKHHIKTVELTQNEEVRKIMRDNYIRVRELNEYLASQGIRLDKSHSGGNEFVGLSYIGDRDKYKMYEEVKRESKNKEKDENKESVLKTDAKDKDLPF